LAPKEFRQLRPPQDLPGGLSILGPDHDLVLSPDPPPLTSAGPAIGQARHASDACAAQQRREHLGFRLTAGDLNDDKLVR
jgi:hypothetical protein